MKDLQRETEELSEKIRSIVVDESVLMKVREDKKILMRQSQDIER